MSDAFAPCSCHDTAKVFSRRCTLLKLFLLGIMFEEAVGVGRETGKGVCGVGERVSLGKSCFCHRLGYLEGLFAEKRLGLLLHLSRFLCLRMEFGAWSGFETGSQNGSWREAGTAPVGFSGGCASSPQG